MDKGGRESVRVKQEYGTLLDNPAPPTERIGGYYPESGQVIAKRHDPARSVQSRLGGENDYSCGF